MPEAGFCLPADYAGYMGRRDTAGRRQCRFCGVTGRLTREHWLPTWTHPLIPEAAPAPYVAAEENGMVDRIWDAPLGSMTVRRVCDDCNNGWMSRLEKKVQPVLTPMLAGRTRALNAEDQGTLATWAAKTVLAFDLTRTEPVVPDECRAWVRTHGTPPPGSIVLLARYGGSRFPVYGSHGTRTVQVGVGDGPKTDWRTFLTSVSAGPVVVQLWGHGIENAVDMKPTNWKADFAHKLWPEPLPVSWPLPRALGDDGLRRFVKVV